MKRIIYSNYLVWLVYQWIIAPVLLVIVGIFIIITAMLEAMRRELIWMKKQCTEVELSIKYSVYKESKKKMYSEEVKARNINRRLAKYLRDKEEITEEDIEEAAERETQDSLIFEEAEALANRFNI